METFFEDIFVYPYLWPLLLVLIPFAVIVAVIYQNSNRAVRMWFSGNQYTFFLPELKLVLRGIALVFLVLAMMAPYWGRMEQQIAKLGREVYILVDVSASMNAEDIKPSRISKVKKELKRMITELKGDKVGLIVFTSDAYVQCPLTSDQKAVMLFLDLIGTYQFANTGTSFRSALSMALDRFENTEKSARKTTRSIVLISDGEDFGENFTSVVDRLQQADVSLFTVGVGTYAGAQVPNIVRGTKRGYKKGEDGSVAISQLNDQSLKDLASSFNTQYHAIDDQIDNLDPVTDQIKLQSATVLDKENRLTSVNRFQIFLFISIIAAVLSMFVMPFRSEGDRRTARS